MRKTLLTVVALTVAVGLATSVAYALQTFNEDVTINGVTTLNGTVTQTGISTVVLSTPGRIGIGTTAPAQRLHLSSTSGTSMRFRIQNGEGFSDFMTDGGKFHLAHGGVTSRLVIDSTGKVGIGTANPQKLLDIAGEGRMTVLNITGGSDLSEQFNIQSDDNVTVEPGMVVSIDPDREGELRVTTEAYDSKVAGIVSGAGNLKTGMTMGQHGTLAAGDHPVALTGRVYCYATTSNGAIQPGDLLTTSSTPGHAMKVNPENDAHGAILGKAMTELASGEGLVLVLVSLQ